MVLNNPELIPDESILKEVLTEKSYILYVKLLKIITSENESKFSAEWRYYNDGKSWLCKVVMSDPL